MSSAPEKPASPNTPIREAIGRSVALLVSLAVVGAALAFLWWSPFRASESAPEKVATPAEWASIVAPNVIRVVPDSPLDKKIRTEVIKDLKGSWPLLTVTGFVVARLEKGAEQKGHPLEAHWDFQTMELATAYADWLKARADAPFAELQLEKIQALAKARVKAQTKLAERMRKLVAVGTDSEKDLAAVEADLIQAQLTAQKEVFEAQTAVKTAHRNRATLERQLYQAGVDPHLLIKGGAEMSLVVAEVPETRVNQVKVGQACLAQFYAYPGPGFPASVGSLAPTLTKDRRTLRVFFQVPDMHGRLKPGMFADVALGTEPRVIRAVPAEAVIHVGSGDFVLVKEGADSWRVTEVKLGENQGRVIEVLAGLQAGDRVIVDNAILFKPLMARSLTTPTRRGNDGMPW